MVEPVDGRDVESALCLDEGSEKVGIYTSVQIYQHVCKHLNFT